jgi:hypothetical protein
MCMADCVVERDAAGNRKLKKKRSSGRIDGADRWGGHARDRRGARGVDAMRRH